jgi:hypothetical protein
MLRGRRVSLVVAAALAAVGSLAATPARALPDIGDLAARAKSGQVQLTWTNTIGSMVGSDTVTGYNVYRGTLSSGPYSNIGDSTSSYSTFLDNGATDGTAYYFVVRERRGDGVELTQSNEATATPMAGPPAYAFHIDGINYGPSDALPAGINVSGFDTTTGLGTVAIKVTGAGVHTLGLFIDPDLDAPVNTFFNEIGTVQGTAAAGQSWEIDEPGYDFGDIFDNFQGGTLDNTTSLPTEGDADDVAMAMMWTVTLSPAEMATALFTVTDILPDPPSSTLALVQQDAENRQLVRVLEGSLSVTSVVAEPSALAVMAVALLGLARPARRRPAGQAGTAAQ